MHHEYAAITSRLYPGSELQSVERLTGGVSADVYRLYLQLADGGNASLVLRAHGSTHSGHSAELEYQLLNALHQGGVPVPEPLTVDVSGELLADPYLVMAFVQGSSALPGNDESRYFQAMAGELQKIHALPTADLPPLPARLDPLPEVFDFLPKGAEWEGLREYLGTLNKTAYTGAPKLLHGDFWPENLLWQDDAVAAILDWEDAALGDPLSDVACCRVELRYRFGVNGMQAFTEAYARHTPLDAKRLALWQVYVCAAAQRYMGDWGLEADLESHMRTEALASIREAAVVLMEE